MCLGIGLGLGGRVAGGQVEPELGGLLGVAAAIVAFVGVGNLVSDFIARNTAQNADIAPLS